jgi:uncharacterized protein
LFTDPTLLNGYIASSPLVTYAGRFAFQQEAEYAENHTDLPARLFVGVGELEDIVYPVKEFTQMLDGRNYLWFEMEVRVIEGDGHVSNKPEIYNRGLRFIFSK